MLSDFEQQLADVLGGRLPAPFTGRVEVAPGPLPGPGPAILLGVQQAEPMGDSIGGQHTEIVPGSANQRRVLRLKCTVGVEIQPSAGQGRPEQVRGLEAALYVLDAPDLRDGSALAGTGDPGFLIQEMRIGSARSPLDPGAPDALPVSLTLDAEGWFWPIGETGEAGVQIGEIRVRGTVLPLEVTPARPKLVAGGTAVALTLRLRTTGLLRVGDQAGPPLPFATLALALVGPGGRPGAGTLTGGTTGAGGIRLVELTDDIAMVTYTPPAEAATDELVVALDDSADGMGIEIGRFALQVRET